MSPQVKVLLIALVSCSIGVGIGFRAAEQLQAPPLVRPQAMSCGDLESTCHMTAIRSAILAEQTCEWWWGSERFEQAETDVRSCERDLDALRDDWYKHTHAVVLESIEQVYLDMGTDW